MPFLDPTSALVNPDTADMFNVTRRPEVIDAHGLSTVPAPVTYPRVVGVVDMAGPDDLTRLEESDRTERAISVVTKFKLQATVAGVKPDLVVWRGDTYVVKTVDPYPQFGGGFIQAICGSIDLQDVTP